MTFDRGYRLLIKNFQFLLQLENDDCTVLRPKGGRIEQFYVKLNMSLKQQRCGKERYGIYPYHLCNNYCL